MEVSGLTYGIPAQRRIDDRRVARRVERSDIIVLRDRGHGMLLYSFYEIQIQESYKNVTYADGQAAAIYGQTPPKVNASVPKGEWQSYDIVFEAPVYQEKGLVKPAYVTVIHNGVKVHDRQEIYGSTTHKKVAQYPSKHSEKAPLRLQWHGDPIEFRNIWIKERQ